MFQTETKCDGWRIVCLSKDTSAEVPSVSSENSTIPDIHDYVAAVYDRKSYVGKVLVDVDDTDACISFLEHEGSISNNTIFREPNRKDELWVDFNHVLCVIPEPIVTKRGRKLAESVTSMINECFTVWISKN